ncbi:adenyl-nucleotide exchange factor sse1, partial [Cladochytrium tenue]
MSSSSSSSEGGAAFSSFLNDASQLLPFGLAPADLLLPGLVAAACATLAVLVYRRSSSTAGHRGRAHHTRSKRSRLPGPLLDDSAAAALPASNAISVVGIDLGCQSSVVAVARNRGVDVVTNDVSNRATPTLVSFGDKRRFTGESAKTQEVSNYANTVSSLKRLLGRPYCDSEVQSLEQRFVTAELVEGEGGEVAAK